MLAVLTLCLFWRSLEVVLELAVLVYAMRSRRKTNSAMLEALLAPLGRAGQD